MMATLLVKATRALELLNYTPIQGRPCRICPSHRDPSQRLSGAANLFVADLDPTMDAKSFHETRVERFVHREKPQNQQVGTEAACERPDCAPSDPVSQEATEAPATSAPAPPAPEFSLANARDVGPPTLPAPELSQEGQSTPILS
ncbi:hypothetical protein PAPYR_6876 [Paratrimastix pyriformis]|uniref:Uncharacterized protein n=1 Tax=Paratrimastix pyriformis TaxID=342808 RepID=A0ABQ8UJK3_9EUKA|nr:hypothetical protein PAPYR_6876 [Paratrimastix pyriformis]